MSRTHDAGAAGVSWGQNIADRPALEIQSVTSSIHWMRGESENMGGNRWHEAVAARLRHLDLILGSVLLLAGILKSQKLLSSSVFALGSGFPRTVLICAAAFELAFGSWLLAGLCRRMTRWLALFWFTTLAAVALKQAMDGVSSCGCLGELHTHPWVMFSFDIAAMAALWIWTPSSLSSAWRFPLAMCLLSTAALLILGSIPHTQPLFAEIDLGKIVQGGQTQQAFERFNDSGAVLNVTAIETSCPCVSMHLDRSDILPAGFLRGIVMVDLGRKAEFTGDLLLEAKGLTPAGRVAFVIVVRARVQSLPKLGALALLSPRVSGMEENRNMVASNSSGRTKLLSFGLIGLGATASPTTCRNSRCFSSTRLVADLEKSRVFEESVVEAVAPNWIVRNGVLADHEITTDACRHPTFGDR